jgi:lipid II:glycine glycyltransferase (peptidoglycan interpeptide bridge formation enzyme)
MARVFSQTRGYRSLTIATEANGELRALASAALISYASEKLSPLGTRAVIIGGPIGDPESLPPLLEAYDAAARRCVLATQVRNLERPTSSVPYEHAGYRWEDHLNYIVDLRQGADAVFAGIAKDRRRNILKAERLDLKAEVLSSGDVSECYELLKQTYSRARIPLADISLFRSAFEILLPREMLWALGVRFEERLCAVALLLRWGGTVHNWYNATSESAWNLHANEWLLWKAMQRAADQGCFQFDMGGAGKPGEAYGPGQFKQRYGGRKCNPGRFERLHHPLLYKVSTLTYQAWRGLH